VLTVTARPDIRTYIVDAGKLFARLPPSEDRDAGLEILRAAIRRIDEWHQEFIGEVRRRVRPAEQREASTKVAT
jgi:hypothetical protein